MKTDIEIAQEAEILPIIDVAKKAEIPMDALELYGNYKAKIDLAKIDETDHQLGKLVLVTSINPTPAGEGKSTVTIGLADALQAAGKKAMIALREPSLGPVMGLKGGATGGGYAQVIPMEDINLHFTGDFHALTSAHNTLAALLDNSIQQGNQLNIDPRKIIWKRALDVNDRALRRIVIGLGGAKSGVPREDGFDITVASELMAILTLSKDINDLKKRIEQIVLAYSYDDTPVTVKDLGVAGAITVLLKDAIKPNLVQTLEHTPALVHGGPFANIAQGTNSVLATQTAMKLADYVVTEAGFGADLGGEKFLDVKTPLLDKSPDTIVIVATIRALKMHGGMAKSKLNNENLEALRIGSENLKQHINAMSKYNIPVVVAINKFSSDTDAEIEFLTHYVEELKIPIVLADVWAKGSLGAQDLADVVLESVNKESNYRRIYDLDDSINTKIEKIVTNIYGGSGVEFSDLAKQQMEKFAQNGWDKLPIVMAKTQYSLSDNAKLLGSPKDFTIHVRELIPKLGAGFIVALTGNVLTMPGLPKEPAANKIDIDEHGKIIGLF